MPDIVHRTPAPKRSRGTGNAFSFLALMCGITSWVPLIVVITGPLTFAFFAIAHLIARREGEQRRLNAAWTGVVLALLSLALQVGLAFVAAVPGWLGAGDPPGAAADIAEDGVGGVAVEDDGPFRTLRQPSAE